MPLLEVEKLVNKYYVNKYLDFALKIYMITIVLHKLCKVQRKLKAWSIYKLSMTKYV